MEGRSQSSKGLNNEAWKDEIDTGKIGAGYFLSLKGRPDFDPLEYVSFRGLTWAEAERLLPAEWTGWVQDLKTNTYKHIQRRAVSAPILTVHDIYNFYKNQLLDHHELGILGESSQQVVSGGHQLASLLQERQRYPNRTTTSASVPESQGENALLAVSPASERTKGKTVMAPCATEGDLTGGSHERPEADEAVDTLGELESGHRKRQATESEAARKTKNRKKAPNGEAMAAMHKAHIESRKRRYNLLDKTLFWRLESGRAVETVLHDASLQLGATTSICSYVIDVSCRTTKALFEDDEWNEILIKTRFDLPQLPQPTLLFLDRLRQSVLQGKHPNYVPLPNSGTTDPKDLADCILAQKTAAEWHFLYHKEPSPFAVDDLSESWWARESWAALHDLLNDMSSIFMVDGEKRGLDSSRRRNMGRRFNPEEPTRRRCGKKLDLICRDEHLLHDWMVVERMRHWDLQSTKLLKEFGCDVLRETVTIAHNRMFEVSAVFRRSCVFFGGYTGDTGFGFFQLHPATEESYVLIMEPQQFYTLPRTKNNLHEPFKGLVKLLRIRTAVKSTIEAYRQLHHAQQPLEDVEDQEAGEADLTWMTEDPVGLFDPSVVVASSPLGPDDFSPDFSDQGLPDENDC